MARLLPPPPAATLAELPPAWRVVGPGTLLFRLYFRGGNHPTTWNTFRAYGPTGARFDHHTYPRRVQERRTSYAALSLRTCIAEVFQQTGVIDMTTNEPAVAGFHTAAAPQLLDLSGHWPTAAGASMAINTGAHARARAWSRTLHAAYPTAQGLWYCSSMDANAACLALYERAEAALPPTPAAHFVLGDPRLRAPLIRYATVLNYRLALQRSSFS
ncbi:MAG: RES family NAD+ phosphorylase [Chloroflexi bacterium]|nr:RES family NAD+ phosphorylase [Chloroflexota bacterium]